MRGFFHATPRWRRVHYKSIRANKAFSCSVSGGVNTRSKPRMWRETLALGFTLSSRLLSLTSNLAPPPPPPPPHTHTHFKIASYAYETRQGTGVCLTLEPLLSELHIDWSRWIKPTLITKAECLYLPHISHCSRPSVHLPGREDV